MPRKADPGCTRKVQIITMMDADDAQAVRDAAANEEYTVSQFVRRALKKQIGLPPRTEMKKRKRATK